MVLDIQLRRLDRDAPRNSRQHPGPLAELVREQEGGHAGIRPQFRRERPAEPADSEDRNPHAIGSRILGALSLFAMIPGGRIQVATRRRPGRRNYDGNSNRQGSEVRRPRMPGKNDLVRRPRISRDTLAVACRCASRTSESQPLICAPHPLPGRARRRGAAFRGPPRPPPLRVTRLVLAGAHQHPGAGL